MTSSMSSHQPEPTQVKRARRLPEGLSFTDSPTTGVQIDLPKATGLVADQGAQVLRWQPQGQQPVLWLSPESGFGDAAIRGGIPICFPWFGPGVDGNRTPAHGVARSVTWQLMESGAPNGVAHLLYRLTGADIAASQAPGVLPEGATAWLSIALDGQLRLDLTVQAGAEPFTYEAALHTYFAVGDLHRTRVTGLDGRPYWDKAAGGVDATQQGDIEFGAEVDRVFDHTGATAIVDEAWNRTISIATRDSASTIVWNPGPEKGAALPDAPDDAWTQFVCVETGNVREHAITLQPGESHTMAVLYTLQAN